MIDKIVKDVDNEDNPVKASDEYIEELISKINEIIDWINSQ